MKACSKVTFLHVSWQRTGTCFVATYRYAVASLILKNDGIFQMCFMASFVRLPIDSGRRAYVLLDFRPSRSWNIFQHAPCGMFCAYVGHLRACRERHFDRQPFDAGIAAVCRVLATARSLTRAEGTPRSQTSGKRVLCAGGSPSHCALLSFRFPSKEQQKLKRPSCVRVF